MPKKGKLPATDGVAVERDKITCNKLKVAKIENAHPPSLLHKYW